LPRASEGILDNADCFPFRQVHTPAQLDTKPIGYALAGRIEIAFTSIPSELNGSLSTESEPEGRVGERPFALIRQGMEEENRWAIAQVVLHDKERLVLLRPQGRLLLMTVLDRESQVTKPTALEELAPKAEPGPEERELAKKLIAASSTELDFSQYRDVYKEEPLMTCAVMWWHVAATPGAAPQRQGGVRQLVTRVSTVHAEDGSQDRKEDAPENRR
jgi:non-homologous end joining protein Ku